MCWSMLPISGAFHALALLAFTVTFSFRLGDTP
jgi:hypothetical protein